jgi:DNA-binding MarR family transcriptional regulator
MKFNKNQTLLESLFKMIRHLKTYPRNLKDLSILQMHTLIFVKRHKNAPMHEIAECFQITKPTATSLTDKLIKGGYVRRTEDKKDRRIIRISLTKKGEKFLAEDMARTGSRINSVLNSLSIQDKKDLSRIVNKINETVEEEHEKNIK